MRRVVVAVVLLLLVVAGGAVLLALRQAEDSQPPGTSPLPSPSPPTSHPPSPTAPGTTVRPCPRADTPRLTALTMNIHFARSRTHRLQLGRIAQELHDWDADVILLQEVDRGRARSARVDQARRLGDRLGMAAAYGPNRRVRGGSSGNAVLSRFPILHERNRGLPSRPGLYPRGVLRTTLDVGGHEVDVLATHLDSRRRGVRRAQARVVAEAVRRTDRPVMVGGDLNTEPGTHPVHRLLHAGLTDAWAVAGTGQGLTAPAASPRHRIDYLLAGPAFDPVRSQVLISSVSDHRAVRATFRLLPPRCR